MTLYVSFTPALYCDRFSNLYSQLCYALVILESTQPYWLPVATIEFE